jgi:hypothetical protein
MARIFINGNVFPERFPPTTPGDAADTTTVQFNLSLADPIFAGQLPLQVGDIIEFGQLPADCVITDYIWDNDAVDTNGAPTCAANFGILTEAPGTNDPTRTLVTTFEAAKAFTAANFSRMPNNTPLRTASQTYDQGLGLVVTAVAATLNANANINLHLRIRSQPSQ